MTASTLAVALIAPFTGTVADVLGRKRVIVAAMLVLVGADRDGRPWRPTLHALIFWRVVQGLVMPPIFAVTVAYIGDELSPHEATTAAGIYSSGSSLGGFSGRLFTGILADSIGWRYGFVALAAMTFAGAIAVAFLLPHERKFVRSAGLLASGKQMLRAFAQPAAGRDLRGRLRRAVQFHRDFYLRQLSSGRTALQFFSELARRDLRRLSRRHRTHSVDRLGGRPVRPAAISWCASSASGSPGSR